MTGEEQAAAGAKGAEAAGPTEPGPTASAPGGAPEVDHAAEERGEAGAASAEATAPEGALGEVVRQAFADYLDKSGARAQYGDHVNVDLAFLKAHGVPMVSMLFRELATRLVPQDLKLDLPARPSASSGPAPGAASGSAPEAASGPAPGAASGSAPEAASPGSGAASETDSAATPDSGPRPVTVNLDLAGILGRLFAPQGGGPRQ